jgi:tetratricopeptide (TPR) repeat protein
MKTKLITVFLLLITGIIGFLFLTNQKKNIPDLSPRPEGFSSSAEYLNARHSVDYYRKQIESNPNEIRNYIELAQVFLQEARVSGMDLEYIPKALSLIEDALKMNPDDIDANVTKASIFLSQHQFNKAKVIIEKVTASKPHFAFAYGVLCDTYVETGEYEKAVEACDKMLSIRPDLRSYSRASYLRELHGKKEEAIDAMIMAANAGVTGQENRAWVLYNLGLLLIDQNKLDSAEYIFRGIFEERPEYAFAYAGLSEVKLAEKDYTSAIQLLNKAYKIIPQHEFLEELAAIYFKLGDSKKFNELTRIILDEFETHDENGWNINLEYARFCADYMLNLDEALEKIKSEFNMRPKNIEVIDTYAWLLYRKGESRKAADLIDRVLKFNNTNPDILFHAGVIFQSLNMNDKALDYLEKAGDNNLRIIYSDDLNKRLNQLNKIAMK